MLNIVNVSPVAVLRILPTHNAQGHIHSPAHSCAHVQSAKPCIVLHALTWLICGKCFTVFFSFVSKCYASWCNLYMFFANYTAWKQRLEKKNHDLVPELAAYYLTRTFSQPSHQCGHNSLSHSTEKAVVGLFREDPEQLVNMVMAMRAHGVMPTLWVCIHVSCMYNWQLTSTSMYTCNQCYSW